MLTLWCLVEPLWNPCGTLNLVQQWWNPGRTLAEPLWNLLKPPRTALQPSQNLVEHWWNTGGTLVEKSCGTVAQTTPDHLTALAEPGGTLVEPWWNCGGTLVEPCLKPPRTTPQPLQNLVEPWWNPCGTLPQTTRATPLPSELWWTLVELYLKPPRTWWNVGGTFVEPYLWNPVCNPRLVEPYTLRNLVEPWWNLASNHPGPPRIWWNLGGTVVEPWWNPGGTLVESCLKPPRTTLAEPGGTLVELSWNLTSNHPRPSRSPCRTWWNPVWNPRLVEPYIKPPQTTSQNLVKPHGSTKVLQGQRGGPGWFEARFHQASTRVPPGFHQRTLVQRNLTLNHPAALAGCGGTLCGTLVLWNLTSWWNPGGTGGTLEPCLKPYWTTRCPRRTWWNPGGTVVEPCLEPPCTTPQPLQNLVEPWWNPGGTLMKHCPAALEECGGTLVEPWWNPGGTLVEPWWNLASNHPGPPRSPRRTW